MTITRRNLLDYPPYNYSRKALLKRTNDMFWIGGLLVAL